MKLSQIKHLLPITEFSYFKTNTKTGIEFYRVLESDYQLSITVDEFKQLMTTKWESYGERSRQAKENKGIDWKALSHAYRAAIQLREIYFCGTIRYPLDLAEHILKIKQGEVSFTDCDEIINRNIEAVKYLADNSSYPEEVDESFWEQFILDLYLGDER